MKRPVIIRTLLRFAATLAVAAVAGGCIEQPEQTQWNDVSAFAWPRELGTTMRYKVTSSAYGIDTTIAEIRAGKDEYHGQPMYRIHTRTDSIESSVNAELHFFANRDTLYTTRALVYEGGLKATYALIAPLEPGHTWIAAYADGTDSATVRATILERYTYWKSREGKIYQNVIAVRYEALDQANKTEWIRFYAENTGVILTVRNVYPTSTSPFDNPPEEVDRMTLMDTPAAP
jgi:hypothetical protein